MKALDSYPVSMHLRFPTFLFENLGILDFGYGRKHTGSCSKPRLIYLEFGIYLNAKKNNGFMDTDFSIISSLQGRAIYGWACYIPQL